MTMTAAIGKIAMAKIETGRSPLRRSISIRSLIAGERAGANIRGEEVREVRTTDEPPWWMSV